MLTWEEGTTNRTMPLIAGNLVKWVRRRTVGLILVSAAACSRHAPEPAWPAAGTVPECPIIVDVRWKLGLSGEYRHRSLWISSGDESASGPWREVSLEDDEDPEAQHWLDHVTRYRDRTFALCDQAFDALYAGGGGSLPVDDFVAKYGRKEHLVLPSPALDRVVIRHWLNGQRGIIELPSRQEIPWTSDGNWGDGHKAPGIACWSADGTRLALALGRDGYAGPGRIAEQHSFVLILDTRTGELVRQIDVNRGIQNICFGPGGTRLALLVSDYFLGDGLLERWGASIGHGRPYSNLYVQIVDLATGEVTEDVIARDLPEVAENLMWDPAAVTTWGWEPR